MGIRLWVDDERVEPEGWCRASNARNAIRILETTDVETLSLDHDLDSHVDTRNGESRELTGYDVVLWIEGRAAGWCWSRVPLSIVCHSANPVGRKRIEQAIEGIKKLRRAAR